MRRSVPVKKSGFMLIQKKGPVVWLGKRMAWWQNLPGSGTTGPAWLKLFLRNVFFDYFFSPVRVFDNSSPDGGFRRDRSSGAVSDGGDRRLAFQVGGLFVGQAG